MRAPLTIIGLAAVLAAGTASTAAAVTTTHLPVRLTFSGDAGGLPDRAGVGTGFTTVLPTPGGNPFQPELLEVDRSAGLLRLTTTAGISYRRANNLDNALGLQLANRGAAVKLHAALSDINGLDQPRTFQQAGLWIGPSQDTYVKLVVIRGRSTQNVHLLYESAGSVAKSIYGPAIQLTGRDVELRLRVEPGTGVITAAYAVDGGDAKLLTTFIAARSLFGESGFTAGIQASHRRATTASRFDFDEVGAVCAADDCGPFPVEPDPDLGDGDRPVGRPGGGGGKPGGGPSGPGTAPKLAARLRVARRVGPRGLRRGVRVGVRCSLPCRYRLRMRVPSAAARRVGLTRRRAAVVVSRKAGIADAGRTAKLVLRLGKRQRRLLSAGGRVPLTLGLVASAGIGETVTRTRRIVLRR